MVRAYVYDLICTIKKDFQYHIKALEKCLYRLAEAGLQLNNKKSFFGRIETKYLGFWVSKNGIIPLPYKVDTVQVIDTPTKVHDIQRFVGIVNYYMEIWHKFANTLYPLA